MMLINIVRASGSLRRLNIRRVEVELEKLREGIPLHLLGNSDERNRVSTDSTNTPSCFDIRLGTHVHTSPYLGVPQIHVNDKPTLVVQENAAMKGKGLFATFGLTDGSWIQKLRPRVVRSFVE